MNTNLPDLIIREQLRTRELLERLLPEKRLLELVESQKASFLVSQSIQERLRTAIDEARKLTEFPRMQLVDIIEQARARELAFTKIHKDSIHQIIEAAATANERISQLINSIQPARDLAERLKLSGPTVLDNARIAKIADMATISRSVQESLKHLEGSSFARTILLSEERHRRLVQSLEKVALNYHALWADLQQAPYSMSKLNPVVFEAPPVEFYQATTLLKSFYRKTNRYRSQEAESILDEAEDNLEAGLSQLDPRLVALYRGAKNALRTPSPDRVRHFAVSLRELITHTLHMLSPDADFNLWNTDPSLIYEGRPTRKGRLLYVCRFVKQGPFTTFVDADVEATVKFIKLFQQGSHALDTPFTERQLRAMLRRAEGLLSYLLDIGLNNIHKTN